MADDMQILTDVENELRWDPSIDHREIGAKVSGGVVTLLGTVAHYADRFGAEEIVKRIKGVRGIANELEVKLKKPGEREDHEIAVAAVSALKWTAALNALPIQVVVKRGWITLSGEVMFGCQKVSAENALRSLTGVVGISNDIVVKPAIHMTDVKRKIESAFQRQAHLDAKNIEIDLEDSQVTLKGTVPSWRER